MAYSRAARFPDPVYQPTLPLRRNLLLKLYAFGFAIFWVVTGLTAPDQSNWLMENSLTVPGVILVYVLYRKQPFSNTTYTLILLFLMLHVFGSQTAYAENPFGFWLQETFSTTRNHYDRLVHFSFGLLLAYPLQEVLYRFLAVKSWRLYLLPIELALSLGAVYEIVEWLVAGELFPQAGPEFLGMQGDIWDPQKDMFLAALGAFITMLLVWARRRFKTGKR